VTVVRNVRQDGRLLDVQISGGVVTALAEPG